MFTKNILKHLLVVFDTQYLVIFLTPKVAFLQHKYKCVMTTEEIFTPKYI